MFVCVVTSSAITQAFIFIATGTDHQYFPCGCRSLDYLGWHSLNQPAIVISQLSTKQPSSVVVIVETIRLNMHEFFIPQYHWGVHVDIDRFVDRYISVLTHYDKIDVRGLWTDVTIFYIDKSYEVQ